MLHLINVFRKSSSNGFLGIQVLFLEKFERIAYWDLVAALTAQSVIKVWAGLRSLRTL